LGRRPCGNLFIPGAKARRLLHLPASRQNQDNGARNDATQPNAPKHDAITKSSALDQDSGAKFRVGDSDFSDAVSATRPSHVEMGDVIRAESSDLAPKWVLITL